MTASTASTAAASSSATSGPTSGPTSGATQSAKSGRTPLILAGAVILLILTSIFLRPAQYTRGAAGDPNNPEPPGTMAVTEVLRSHGVNVSVERSVARVVGARSAADIDTLVISQPRHLTDVQSRALAELPIDVVIIGATGNLPGLADGLTLSHTPRPTPVVAGCADPRADVGQINSSGLMLTAPGASACFPGGDAGLMLHLDRDTPSGPATTTILPGDLFTNARLADEGNAALALRTLGGGERLVWLAVSATDTYGEATADSIDLDWFWPILGCLAIGVLWWRGPRFGPLVAEPLPVVVRASETTLGRGQLYRKSQDLGHAALALRHGAVERMATRIGIPEHAAPPEVVARIAGASGREGPEVAHLLYGPDPADAGSLLALSLSLDALTEEVHRV